MSAGSADGQAHSRTAPGRESGLESHPGQAHVWHTLHDALWPGGPPLPGYLCLPVLLVALASSEMEVRHQDARSFLKGLEKRC